MYKVTAIITTYNSMKTIERCLQSVKNQEGRGSLFDLEIIMVDDHSSDGTWEFINEDKEVIAFRTPARSGGPNKGRNIGLTKSSGDYIAMLDHDDEWMPAKLRRQLEAVPSAKIVTTDFTMIDESTGKIDYCSTRSDKVIIYQPNELFMKLLTGNSNMKDPLFYFSSIMLHKDLKHIRFEEHFGACDYDYKLRATQHQPAAKICTPLVNRYIKSDNLSLASSYRKMTYYYSQLALEEYEEEYPGEVAIALRNLNGTRGRYYYKIGEMKKARKYLLRSRWHWKTLAYLITSFIGSEWVKKRFRIFGS